MQLKNYLSSNQNTTMKTTTPKESKKLCQNCTICCEYINISISAPQDQADIDEIKWYLLHNVHVLIDDEDEWKVKILTKCTALNHRGECSIYRTRPEVCRGYTHDVCEKYDTRDHNYALFTSVKEFEQFLNSPKNKLRLK